MINLHPNFPCQDYFLLFFFYLAIIILFIRTKTQTANFLGNLLHSCQPLLGVHLSPEFVNMYFPYAGWGLLFFRWWQQHFEVQLAYVPMEGRSNVAKYACMTSNLTSDEIS